MQTNAELMWYATAVNWIAQWLRRLITVLGDAVIRDAVNPRHNAVKGCGQWRDKSA